MDYKIYRKFNKDLENYNEQKLMEHFNKYGKYEDRIYNLESLNFKLSKKNIIIEFLKNNGELWETLWKDYKILQKYSLEDREEISLKSKTRVFYYGDEVIKCKLEEENILNDILPDECKDLNKLNILNIGAGGRKINDTLICIDFQRDLKELSHNGHISNSVISDMDDLIFKDNSVDGIIALHIFEHSTDPVKTLTEWLRVLKPGGKIGIINPNYKYNWSSSTDNFKYGHKWNSEINITLKLLKTHFDNIEIIKFDTLKYKLSYNIVLQKKGKFVKNTFKIPLSGYEIDKGQHKDVPYYYSNNKIYL